MLTVLVKRAATTTKLHLNQPLWVWGSHSVVLQVCKARWTLDDADDADDDDDEPLEAARGFGSWTGVAVLNGYAQHGIYSQRCKHP